MLELALDWRVLGFTALLAVLTCVLFGLAPALKATRAGADHTLKGSGRGMTADRERDGLRRALVVGQVALSLVLLVGALLFARSLRNLLTVDPGFRSSGVVVASIDLRQLGAPVEGRRAARVEIIGRISALPGLESVAHADVVPISGSSWGNRVWAEKDGSKRGVGTLFNRISRGYFKTLGISIVAGRDFDPGLDTPGTPLVAIVNESFARAVLNGSNPVGARVTVEATPSTPERTFQVVGLVKDAKYESLREDIAPGAFLADSQETRPGQRVQLLVRSSLPADT